MKILKNIENQKANMHFTHQSKNRFSAIEAKNKGIANNWVQMIQMFGDDHVCPRCEKRALCDVDEQYTCPNCGWHGTSITVKEYYTRKLFT